MGERKVLNKYYPPDFDPEIIPRGEKKSDRQFKVRLMTPFSMRCTTCSEYVYKGKKFNARKETVKGEEYLGIKIFRFYIRCPRCSAEITFKTDPKNADYVCELGALRNFEPWREERIINEEIAAEKEKEEESNPIKALENRTAESKREIDALDALDEIRTMNARHEKVDADTLLQFHFKPAVDPYTAVEREEDERLAKSVFSGQGPVEIIEEVVNDDEAEQSPSSAPPSLNKDDVVDHSRVGLASFTASKPKAGLSLPFGVSARKKAKTQEPQQTLAALVSYDDSD